MWCRYTLSHIFLSFSDYYRSVNHYHRNCTFSIGQIGYLPPILISQLVAIAGTEMQIENEDDIDQDALSRQLAVYGRETQMKLMGLRVYIHGITGLGVEVAKNLILAGPKQVSIFDGKIVTIDDVGRNFYLREEFVGIKTRAQSCLSELQELNPSVMVNVAFSDSIDYITKNFDCVVILDHYDREYLLKLNKAAHANSMGFIYAGNLGLYGFTFVDFGDKHVILDGNGQECQTAHIAGITNEERGLVVLHQDKKHGFSDGDTVCFREVKGMEKINGKMFKIEVKSPESFTVGDTRAFGEYQEGGIAVEVKMPQEIRFDDLEKSLRCPYPQGIKEMPIANWQKFGVPEQLHVILNCLLQFHTKHHRLPRPLDQEDLKQMKALVKSYLNSKMDIEGQEFKIDSVDEKLIKNVALYCQAQISPVSSFWGGIITQQIIKLTGKYTPIRQWLHHEFFQALPVKEVSRSLPNNRYRDYSLLFGSQFVLRVARSNTFLVGAGALGCEFIKMMSLMGFGTDYGSMHVTDDDYIEISNLNRQFLFRRHHVKLNKCETACKVGKTINPNCNFSTYKSRVSPENENIFDEGFWNDLDLVINAVDNVKARQYIDNQCVWFEKPLFQSGTLGTKCHSQIILPHITASYNDLVDPPEKNIPLCTLKNFPYQIEHTIQWARDYFEGTFAEASSDLLNFYQRKQEYLKELASKFEQNPSILRSKLESLLKLSKANSCKNYEVCVELGLDIFQDVFNHQIKQLLICLPPDHVSDQTKKPFWSGLKRLPKALEFDLKDPRHLQLVQSAANIYAAMFDLPKLGNLQEVTEISKKLKPAPFAPKQNVKIDTGQKKQSQTQTLFCQEDEIEVKKLLSTLSTTNFDRLRRPTVVEFEKDDPTNYHIEFMSSVANLRARNYSIEEVDNFKVKLIAGKIIPAIATTTAMVVGAVGIEIIKYLQGLDGSAFKNITANLALPLWVFNDIIEATVYKDSQNDPLLYCPVKAVPKAFTKWDKIHIKGPLSVNQFKQHMEATYNIDILMITYGQVMIYPYYGKNKTKHMDLSIYEAYEDISGKKIDKNKKKIALGVSAETKDKIYCQIPLIVYEL